MRITIDREMNTPVYLQIYHQIRHQIIHGELLPGFRLPPERKLAESLAVNRTTILNAYRELKSEGLVGSQVGKGTIVMAYPDEEPDISSISQEPAWNQVFSQYSGKFDACITKDLLALASRRDVISFATGMASPDIGPRNILEGIEQELLATNNHRALLYSPTEGFTTLREAICGVMRKRGIYCSCGDVMMLSGSQQGIDLVARVLVDPGDIVVIEEPSFFSAIQTFKTLGARVMSVPVDENGMRMDILEQLLQRYRPKMIYTMPTYQNPTGIQMTLERRTKLLELAYKYRILILEDDAYADLCYEGELLPKLKAMDKEGYVIYLSTFSKIVYPGLRLGWMIAHKKVIQKCSALKQTMDLHSNSLSQWMIERFITSGGLDSHLNKICTEYRIRRDAMYDALLQYAPPGLVWNLPKGGFYIWCTLPEGLEASKLMTIAADHKVAFVPGNPFCLSEQGEEAIRLNFTYAPLKDIKEGIRRLCRSIKELMNQTEEGIMEEDIDINPVI